MEYVFGTKGGLEILKVKASAHTTLSGFREVVREYPDQTITDRFRVVKKLNSQEDEGGACYDWYEIDSHYRYTDKALPLSRQIAQSAATAEDAMCELDAGIDERISAVETALCELDEMMNGGKNA